MTPDELLAVDDSIIDADTEDAGKGDDGPEEKAVPVETPGPRAAPAALAPVFAGRVPRES